MNLFYTILVSTAIVVVFLIPRFFFEINDDIEKTEQFETVLVRDFL